MPRHTEKINDFNDFRHWRDYRDRSGLMRVRACVLMFVAMTACASQTRNVRSAQLAKDIVFPLGVYQHDVKLEIHGPKIQSYRFKGVVKISRDNIRVVALSPMGTTVFMVLDDLKTGKVRSEVYMERMRRFQSRINDYYFTIKKLLTLKSVRDLREGSHLAIDPRTVFVFGKWDRHHIPEVVKIKTPQYSVEIKVTGYEI